MAQNNSSTIVGVIIIVLLIVFGVYYWSTHPTSTSNYTNIQTSVPSENTGSVNSPSGVPAVSTKAASSISRSTAILNGDVNPSGAQTSYWYEYGETNALGSFTSPQQIGGGNVNYSAPRSISGLKASTTYYYRVSAQNQNGKVYGSILNFTTTTTAPAKYLPPSVQTKSATGITTDSATISGTVSPNGSSTMYWFEWGDNFSLANATFATTLSSTSGNNSVSTNLTSLTPNQTYYYRVNAQNQYGTVIGTIFSFTTTSTTPPVNTGKAPTVNTTQVTGVTTGSATLHGQVNPNGSATTYYFLYGKSTLFGLFSLDQRTDNKSLGATSTLAGASASLSGLDEGSTYYYQLVAQNQNGTTQGSIYSFTTASAQ